MSRRKEKEDGEKQKRRWERRACEMPTLRFRLYVPTRLRFLELYEDVMTQTEKTCIQLLCYSKVISKYSVPSTGLGTGAHRE